MGGHIADAGGKRTCKGGYPRLHWGIIDPMGLSHGSSVAVDSPPLEHTSVLHRS